METSPPDSPIWLPKFHPKQQFAFDSKATAQLYGGATRGGKTAFIKLALIRWCSAIPGLQCDIFRFNHDDVIANYMDGDFSFPVLLHQWEQDGLCTITKTEVRFWNNSLISLEHCSTDKAMSKHQGIDKHVRVFDEATQIPERRMKWLMGWITMSDKMLAQVPPEWVGQFPKAIFLTNPIGQSAGFFRRRFVLARPKGSIEYIDGFSYQYIAAKVEDNPSVNAEATRARISGTMDAQVADALLNENWDALVGDFIREYNDDIHSVPDFDPPAHWLKWRAFDWGKAEPFNVLWLCMSDGQPFKDADGNERWFPLGHVNVYREWYGCDPEDPAKGLGLSNVEICRGIITRTPEVTSGITVTDNLPFQRRDDELMADVYAKNGVPLTLGNTDRVMGWARVKDFFKGIDGHPMLTIQQKCIRLREYVPALQRHESKPEDAVESGEATHSCDTLRVGIATRGKPKLAPKTSVPNQPPAPKMAASPNELLKQLRRQTRSSGRL